MATIWILFTLLALPYYDGSGAILKGIDGLDNLNPPHVYGGGWVYPEMGKTRVLERYEAGDQLLVRVDLEAMKPEELLAGIRSTGSVLSYRVRNGRAGPRYYADKTAQFNAVDFKATQLSEVQAGDWRLSHGFAFAESGVTK